MFHSVLTASAAKNFASYRSIFRNNLYTDYRSPYSLSKIYPNSSLKITKEPQIPIAKDEVSFSGYIPTDELQITYSRGSGPGGQNVNKVNTKVDVRFHVATAKWLSESLREKIIQKHKNDLNKEGFLVVRSDKTRTQMLNLADCIDKLRTLIFEAIKPKEKDPTEEQIALKAARQERATRERLRIKRRQSEIKEGRRTPTFD